MASRAKPGKLCKVRQAAQGRTDRAWRGEPRQTGQKCSCVGLVQHGFTILGEF